MLIVSDKLDKMNIFFQVLYVLQDLKGNSEEIPNDDGEAAAAAASVPDDAKGNFVEAVVFMKDASQQVAATGTLNGDILIWDIAKQVNFAYGFFFSFSMINGDSLKWQSEDLFIFFSISRR